jgi:nucleoside-specific outer membrane channel protein Tsx
MALCDNPSRKVVARMGYGDDVATVFTGEIDDMEMSAQPRDYSISADCRDMACKLIDKSITLVEGGKTSITLNIRFRWCEKILDHSRSNQAGYSDIVKDLCMRAGFASADVIVEKTIWSLS